MKENNYINKKDLFIGLILLIMVREHFLLLNQIEELKQELTSLKATQSIEEKVITSNATKVIIISCAVIFTAIMFIYLGGGGIDPGNFGKGLNSFGDQATFLTQTVFQNMSEKLTEINSSNIEHLGKLSDQILKFEEKMSKSIIQISNQIVNLRRSPINPKDIMVRPVKYNNIE